MLVEEDMVKQISDVLRNLDGVSRDVPDKITSDTNIVRDLRLDSIAVMDFIMALETKFNTIIPIDAITEIETVGDLANMLRARSAQVPH